MAKTNSKRYFRKHVSPRTGVTSFTTTVRVAGFKSVSETFPTKAAAAEWAAKTEEMLREQKKRGGVRRDVATLTVGDLLREYLADPETVKLRSYDGMHQMASWWIQKYGTLKALDFSSALTLREARDKLTPGRAPGTINRYLIVARSAWNWARASGLVPNDQRWPERLMLTQPPGRTRFLDDSELTALLAAARAHSVLMHTAITVSVATGLRASELLRLNWSDVDFAREVVSVRHSKNDTPRQIHLTNNAVAALRALQGDKVRAIAGAVFLHKDGARLRQSTLEGRWRKIRDELGLTNMRWHDLRHTCASILAQNGATLLQIAEVLGHKSFQMTARYSHLVQGAALPAHAALDAKLRTGGGDDKPPRS
jgi:integrase